MIDRPRNTDTGGRGIAHTNTPGARKRRPAPEIDEGERTTAPGSPEVGEKLNDTQRQLSDRPSRRTSGTPDSPKAANRVDNPRSKKLPETP